MPDWESELRDLLSTLHVSAEADALLAVPAERPATVPGRALLDVSDPSDSMVLAFEQSSMGSYDLPPDFDMPEGDEVNAVRQEIEATVARVARLTRAGQLDRALRDDVVFVLRALTRPQPAALEPRVRDEWHLASAAAALHFCRMVLRLTRPLEPDA